MPRLTSEQWEAARADFEVRGMTGKDVATSYGVDPASVCRRAKKEGWVQGKCQPIVREKVAAHKALAEAERKTQSLPLTFQRAIDQEAISQLALEGLRANFHAALYSRGMELLEAAQDASAWRILTQGAKDLMPAPNTQVTVQQAQQVQPQKTPEEICAELIAEQELDLDARKAAKVDGT